MAKTSRQSDERYSDLVSVEQTSRRWWRIIEYDYRLGVRVSYLFSNGRVFREEVIPREMLMR